MTKVKEIKVTLIQQQCLKPLFEEQKIARTGFAEASRLLHQAEDNLWVRVREFWPNAKRVNHPGKGKWTVIIDED